MGTKNGVFSTKSGYHAAFEESNDAARLESPGNWNQDVWNLRTAPKVKMLVWKALRGALPVGTRLEDRFIQVDPRCKRCGSPESIFHLFFQCAFANSIWQAAPSTRNIDYSGMIDFKETWNCLKSGACLPPAGVSSGHLAPWLLWEIWTARNKLVFSEIRLKAEDSLSRAIVMAREWQDGQIVTVQARNIRKPQIPTPTGNIIRSDAAWSQTSKKAGLGWVIMQGETFATFSTVETNVSSPLMAEGLALREAVRKCRELGISKINVESDSKNLTTSILNGNEIPELYGVVADILSISSVFAFVSFR